MNLIRGIFLGPNGVRAGWRFLAYAVLVIALDLGLQAYAVPPAAAALHITGGGGIGAPLMLLTEVFEGIAVLVPTGSSQRSTQAD